MPPRSEGGDLCTCRAYYRPQTAPPLTAAPLPNTVVRHRPVMNLGDKRPLMAHDCYVAPSATVVGQVDLYDFSSVWNGAVLRGDKHYIKVGGYSSIGDRTVVVTRETLESGFPACVDVGDYVSVGAGCTLESCTIENRVVVGANSTLLEGSLVEKGAAVAPGSVVPPGRRIPAGQLWGGSPAEFIRDLSAEEIKGFEDKAKEVHNVALQHWDELQPYQPSEMLDFDAPWGTAHREAGELRKAGAEL
jgi:carbonic anhydrase/acetyltransferase-like protein (isoleucine patch superfamily)